MLHGSIFVAGIVQLQRIANCGVDHGQATHLPDRPETRRKDIVMAQSRQERSPNMHIIGEGAGLGEDILAALRAIVRRRHPGAAEMTSAPLHVLGEGADLGNDIIGSIRNAFRPAARDHM